MQVRGAMRAIVAVDRPYVGLYVPMTHLMCVAMAVARLWDPILNDGGCN